MKSSIINGVLVAALAITAAPESVMAQKDLPATQAGLVAFGSQKINLTDANETQLLIPTHARYDYAVSGSDWCAASVKDGQIVLDIDENLTSATRVSTVSIRSSKGVTSDITITQPGVPFADYAAQAEADALVPVVYCDDSKAAANSSGESLANSYDGNFSTIYHSSWAGFDSNDSSQWPVLTYFFTEEGAPASESVDIASILYYPRPTPDTNGNFGEIIVEVGTYKSATELTWTPISDGHIDLGMSSSMSNIDIPESLQKGIRGIRITVVTGASNNSQGLCYASCGEMQFKRVKDASELADYALFTDNVLSGLKPGVTSADVEKMTNPLLKFVAQRMLSGEYTSAGRVSDHEAVKSYVTLSNEWSTPGKYYSQIQGVTGVMLSKGQYVVMVEGLDETKGSVEMRCIGWTVEDLGTFTNFYKSESYNLVNGINVIEKTTDWDGLCYICNYNDEGAAKDVPPVVKVHIVGGVVNGIITNTKTNAENQAILDNAAYTTIDCVGQRVQSVWEVEAIKNYAKDQYVRYVNCLDILIAWEHRLLGFEKYNMIPKNRTLAYVNYDYYMYQGGMGVTFKYDTQYRVCSPDKIMYDDDDVVWGLSHEWGHQHQMHPYFCWGGLGETSNNMNSCYNVLHMGYAGSRVLEAWEAGRKNFLQDNYDSVDATNRQDAIDAANNDGAFDWCPAIKTFVQNQSTTITKYADNPRFALGNNEVGVEETLAPLFMLHCYFSEPQTDRLEEDYHPDFTMDMYQSLRQTEKTDTPDKYELLARAQNGVEGAYDQFVKEYPNSVWTKNGYITANSNRYQNTLPFIYNYMVKASKLSGYNLYPFFEKWGYFRNIAILIGDYGNYYYVMMDDMFDEIQKDMDALGLKTMPEELVEKISTAALPHFNTPNIPNDRPWTADDL
jgi:hypothetical protein